MARKAPKLRVVYRERATLALLEVWDWNAEQYKPELADKYLAFLKRATDNLGTTYVQGRPVPTRPDFRYSLFKQRSRGFGHVAVYKVTEDAVEVLDIFHSAQDWHEHVRRFE